MLLNGDGYYMAQFNIIGVILARGGSKRIPLKNIQPINGKPMIGYTIEAARGSKYLRRLLVSTDHQEIKKISLEYGAEVPFDRPADLSTDCPSEWVTQHTVEFVEKEEGKKIDIAVSLQPTTPFVKTEDIDKCLELLIRHEDILSVFSAKVIHDVPEWMFVMNDDVHAKLFLGGELKGDRGVIQSIPKKYVPNGAVYATKRIALFDEGVLISRKTGLHVMPFERSVDIDEPIDLLYAEFLVKGGYVK